MRILAINGSPKGTASNTDLLLQPFLRGAQSSGAEIDMVYLTDKNINHCKGCLTCMQVTPGICAQKDDMAALLGQVQIADVIVYATPLHAYTVSSRMKAFIDRNLPLTFVEPTNKKVILISNCGQPGRQNFNSLVEMFNLMTSNSFRDLAGTILCTNGPILSVEPLKPANQWYLDACEAAGRELVQSGMISFSTQIVLEKDLAVPKRS